MRRTQHNRTQRAAARRFAAALFLLSALAAFAAPPEFNGSGRMPCRNGSAPTACDNASAVNGATHPYQDAHSGPATDSVVSPLRCPPDTEPDYYWSLTTDTPGWPDTWFVYFYDGLANAHIKTSAFRVRRVCDGQPSGFFHPLIQPQQN